MTVQAVTSARRRSAAVDSSPERGAACGAWLTHIGKLPGTQNPGGRLPAHRSTASLVRMNLCTMPTAQRRQNHGLWAADLTSISVLSASRSVTTALYDVGVTRS